MYDRKEIVLPKRINLIDHGQSIEIIRGWFSWLNIFLTFFVILYWEGILFFGSSSVLAVVVGLLLTYYVVAGYLNRTSIKVDRSTISIRHSPLPWWGNRDIDPANIRQLYSGKTVYTSFHSYGLYSHVFYEVRAKTKDYKDIRLLSGLRSSEQALYIEQEIERFLKIEDIPIGGEIPR